MAQNIEFRQYENNLQKNLKNICEKMEREPKLIVPADKTSNFYKLDTEKYEDLLCTSHSYTPVAINCQNTVYSRISEYRLVSLT